MDLFDGTHFRVVPSILKVTVSFRVLMRSIRLARLPKGLLEESLDAEAKHLMAYMLKIPDENYLFEQLERFEVHRIIELKEGLISQIANRYLDMWREIYSHFQSGESFSPMSDAMANRALANLAFEYLARGMDSEEVADFCEKSLFQGQ